MKKLFLFLSLCLFLLSISHAQTKVVGTIENGNITLTVNKSLLLTTYNTKLLSASGIEANFTDVSIKKIDKDYFLVFVGENIKSSFSVEVQGRDLVAKTSISCTTSECSSETNGCAPRNGSACTPCGNNGRCTKTVSSASLLDAD